MPFIFTFLLKTILTPVRFPVCLFCFVLISFALISIWNVFCKPARCDWVADFSGPYVLLALRKKEICGCLIVPIKQADVRFAQHFLENHNKISTFSSANIICSILYPM